MDDYATPNANNPSSDLQLCKMDTNGYQAANISYGTDGRISTITFILKDGAMDIVETYNIIYDTNKIIISRGDYAIDFIFNNELHSYSAETINNQVFHCLTIYRVY